MKTNWLKSSVWRVITITVIINLVMLTFVSTSGLAQPAANNGRGKHNVALAPVAPPQIKTHPLHPTNGKGNQSTPNMVAPMMTSQAAPLAATAAPTMVNSPRDMKVLVISPIAEQYFQTENYDTRYRLQAIKAFLDQLGIPYDVYTANSGGVHNPLPALWDGTSHGYYQGIILEVGSQWIYSGGKNFIPFLTPDEWTALWNYEVMFGVRELVMYLAPSTSNAEPYGLAPGTEGYLTSSTPAAFTPAGQSVYPYLNTANPLLFINTYLYSAVLDTTDPATPLLSLNGSPVVSTHTAADGHQTLAITADYTAYLISSLALSYGSINWLTQGVFLGERHTYLAPQVDDLLIDDNVWDPITLSDTNDSLTYRMSASDLLAVQNWQGGILGNGTNRCVTFQPAAGGKDTYIDKNNPGNNYGNGGTLYTGAPNSKTSDLRTLIQFNLSSIPAGTTITSSNFSIYLSSSSGGADTVNIYPLSRAWVEGSGMAKRAPTGATWTTFDGKTAWTTPGGDFNGTSAGSFIAGAAGWKQADLKTLVQSWINAPDTNNGVILRSLKATSNNNSKKAYYSGDNSNYSLVPKLQVCFTDPTSVFKLEFAFNGEGASWINTPDTLTPAVIQNQANFRWINHTYNHINLDTVSATQTTNQLTQNDRVAINQLGLTNYTRAPFIQPDISGLTNLNFQTAAFAYGVRYLISDTSRTGWNNPSPNAGIYSTLQPGLLIIPRRPTNLFYNLVTKEQWVSEYNCYYGPNATCAGGTWKYWSTDQTYDQILDHESDMMLQYMLKWDVDPLMFHQANLGVYAGSSTLLTDLVNATLAKYNALVTLPIRNLGQSDIGAKMADRMTYNAANVAGTYTPCSGITLTASRSAKVPVTGVSYGSASESYGNQNISYIPVIAGSTVTVPISCAP